ncbi:MAG: hypothetical protein QOG53_3439 [Frankiales bacterium]|nr:hypothetical protein [Frankiales bacterium]
MTTYAMTAAIAPPRLLGRRCELSLYPLDAADGSPAICAVSVMTTHGLPLVTHRFPVEVKGSPRPFGRLVARAGDVVIWPTSRAMSSKRLPKPKRDVQEQPPFRSQVWVPEWRVPNARWWQSRLAAYLGTLAVASALATATVALTLTNRAEAKQLERSGDRVIAEVLAVIDDGTALRVRYTAKDGREVVGAAPADYPEDYTVGRRYPAVTTPSHPSKLRLSAEPYDPVEPIVFGVIPFLAAAFVVGRRLGWFHRSKFVSRTRPWQPVDAVPLDEHHLMIRRPGSAITLCTAAVPRTQMPPAFWQHQVLSLQAAGELAPRCAIALRDDDVNVVLIGPAGADRAMLNLSDP